MTTPSDDLDRLKSEGDVLSRVESLESKVNGLFRESIEAVSVDEITTDLGEIRMGRFLATQSDGDPTDSTFNGVFMVSDPETFGTIEYHFGGVNSGELMFGGNATTGRFDFCGGLAYIDADGITGSDLLKWLIKQVAENGGNTRTGKLGMALADGGGTTPVWEMSYSSLPTGGELVVNGGAEEGDFTGWTKTTETNGAWYLTPADGITYELIRTGDHSFTGKIDGTDGTLVLTSDRMAVTAGKSYQASGYYFPWGTTLNNRILPTTAKIEVKWYDHASAGSLIQTDVLQQSVTPNSWNGNEQPLEAPTGALSAAVVLTMTANPIGLQLSYCSFDDISFEEVSISTKLWLADDGVHASPAFIVDGSSSYPRSITLWPEECTSTTALTHTTASAQRYCTYSGIDNSVDAQNDSYDWSFVCDSGTYTLEILYFGSTYNATADVKIDGTVVIDDFSFRGSGNNLYKTQTGINIATGGLHTLQVLCHSAGSGGTSYCFFHTKITLKRTGDPT